VFLVPLMILLEVIRRF